MLSYFSRICGGFFENFSNNKPTFSPIGDRATSK